MNYSPINWFNSSNNSKENICNISVYASYLFSFSSSILISITYLANKTDLVNNIYSFSLFYPLVFVFMFYFYIKKKTIIKCWSNILKPLSILMILEGQSSALIGPSYLKPYSIYIEIVGLFVIIYILMVNQKEFCLNADITSFFKK